MAGMTPEEFRAKVREWEARVTARQSDPTLLANAQKLAEETRDSNEISASLERRNRLIRSGVPEEHWPHLDAPKDRAPLAAVREFLSGPDELRFLVLAGDAGVGKSFAMSWAIYARGGEFVNAHALANTSTFDAAFWDRLEGARLLAIEELGAEKAHDAYESRLYGLLNVRYSRNRKTLIATNLDAAGFRAFYMASGLERLADRLRTSARWVNLPGESMRQHWSETEPHAAAGGA